MNTDGSSKESPATPRSGHTGDGMVVLSYILSGLLFYGGFGWLGDRVFGVSWLVPLGIIVGVVASIYLIIKRYGSTT